MSSDSLLRGRRLGAAVNLEQEAQETLQRARAEASALLAEARHEAEVMVRERFEEALAQARVEGVEAGRAQGRDEASRTALEEAREAVARLAEMLTAAVKAFENATGAARADAEAGLVRLAAAIGERLALKSIEADVEAAHALVGEAIELVADRTEVRVLVSPVEYESLESLRDVLREEYPEIIRIAFERDADVARGGCRIVTSSATVDASLSARADAIASQLLSGRRSA